MRLTGAYKLQNLLNGKCYVGGTGWRFDLRLRKHCELLKKNKHPNQHLQSDYNYYGVNGFEFDILEFAEKEDIVDVEQKWLDIIKPWINGYNIARKSIPSSGYFDKETYNKWLSTLRSPEYVEKRRKISKEYAIKTARPIAVYTKSGDYVATFNNIEELIQYSQSPNCDLPMVLNKTSKGKTLRREHINRVLCGMRTQMKGLIFKYAD